jgi:hypothetical protein
MKNSLLLLIVLLTTSCATFTVSTLNHDPIYDDENYYVVGDNLRVDTLNEFQFRNKLRTDIGFRLDFARYALSQPVSFDWNNRLLGRQYDYRYNSYYWNRDQMWNDWAWGYTGGILGVLLIDGHHLDMIDGDMESTMVGITTDGDIMGTMVMDGIIITGGTITVKMVGTEDEVEIMCRISTVEEVVL